MKKIPLILLLAVALFSTLACGLFSALTGSTEETEEVVLQPAYVEEVVTEEVVTEEVPIGDSVVVLFQDDFSDVNSGWDRNDWDNGFTDYVDGVYQIVVKTDNHDVWRTLINTLVGCQR